MSTIENTYEYENGYLGIYKNSDNAKFEEAMKRAETISRINDRAEIAVEKLKNNSSFLKAINAIKDRKNAGENMRLFLDMDGMLAEYRKYQNEEQYLQNGYYFSLSPHENVVAAIKVLRQLAPELPIFALSAYFDSPDAIAVTEKNAWLDDYLHEIGKSNRIYTICGHPKQDYIEGGITDRDFLMDDYTKNLVMWEEGNGVGIKLLNGQNGRLGSWDGSRLWYKNEPANIALSIAKIIGEKEIIKEQDDEVQLRNEKLGVTLYISKDKLSEIVERFYSDKYDNVDAFRLNFTNEEWLSLRRFFSDYVTEEKHTSLEQFKFEYDTFKEKLKKHLDGVLESFKERQADNLKTNIDLTMIERILISQTPSQYNIDVIKKNINHLDKRYVTTNKKWNDFKNSTFEKYKNDIFDFFKKYETTNFMDASHNPVDIKQFKVDTLAMLNTFAETVHNTEKESLKNHHDLMARLDKLCGHGLNYDVYSHSNHDDKEDILE